MKREKIFCWYCKKYIARGEEIVQLDGDIPMHLYCYYHMEYNTDPLDYANEHQLMEVV